MATPDDTAAPAAEPSIREALTAAFDEAAADASASPAPADPRADDDAPPAAPAATPAPAAPADSTGQQRDDKGRFAPANRTPGQPQPGQPGQPPAQQQAAQRAPGAPMPPAPQPVELKAPASWKPQARELWATVPPEVRAEVHRREAEHQHTMQQAAGARQFVEAFERVVRPYEVFIRAENSTPLDAVDNLMRMAAVMRTGSPAAKVDVVANIIRQWGVDLPMLDSVMAAHLNGQPAPQFTQQQQQPFRDPRLDELLAAQQRQMLDAQRAQQVQLTSEIDAFAQDPAHEFFHDVRPIMSDLIAMAAQRGQVLTMADAYNKACQLDDNVSKILAQRASARAAGTNTQAALRARRAAASIKGDTTLADGATVPRDDSIRASLEAAFAESESRAQR